MRERLRHLIAETEGGPNRARIIAALDRYPANTNQLAERLDLNYNTVRYHLSVLRDHGIVESAGDGYGELHYLTDAFEHHRDAFERALERLE